MQPREQGNKGAREQGVSCLSSAANEERCTGRARQRISRVLACAGVAAVLLTAGCRQDMHNEPKMFPQRGSTMFVDHRGARPQVPYTVARGQLHADSYFYTGLVKGPNGSLQERDLMPFPVTMTVLRRGQERFNLYCTPCHSRVGNGLGEIVMRGYKPAANFHDQVRLGQPVSHYFYVMTHGFGAMPDYAAQLTPADRWAVAAYIRALQYSQVASTSDVPAGVHIRTLKEIAQQEGLPASDAGPWTLPATAVWANRQAVAGEGTPAMAPANSIAPKISIPVSKPAAKAAK